MEIISSAYGSNGKLIQAFANSINGVGAFWTFIHIDNILQAKFGHNPNGKHKEQNDSFLKKFVKSYNETCFLDSWAVSAPPDTGYYIVLSFGANTITIKTPKDLHYVLGINQIRSVGNSMVTGDWVGRFYWQGLPNGYQICIGDTKQPDKILGHYVIVDGVCKPIDKA